jgi:hypothetical protein
MIILEVHNSRFSKPDGSNFWINTDHIDATMSIVKKALADVTLVDKDGRLMRITITAMYKAQVGLYIEYVEKEFSRKLDSASQF